LPLSTSIGDRRASSKHYHCKPKLKRICFPDAVAQRSKSLIPSTNRIKSTDISYRKEEAKHDLTAVNEAVVSPTDKNQHPEKQSITVDDRQTCNNIY
jgi:hypothetical protein